MFNLFPLENSRWKLQMEKNLRLVILRRAPNTRLFQIRDTPAQTLTKGHYLTHIPGSTNNRIADTAVRAKLGYRHSPCGKLRLFDHIPRVVWPIGEHYRATPGHRESVEIR
jgi:hypothetical protein